MPQPISSLIFPPMDINQPQPVTPNINQPEPTNDDDNPLRYIEEQIVTNLTTSIQTDVFSAQEPPPSYSEAISENIIAMRRRVRKLST